MKKVYFCVDFEEWFHIPYLKKYNFSKDDYPPYSNKIESFFEWLNMNGIIANVFVVGDIAKDNASFLKKCREDGHTIGCHSMHHFPINKMSNEEFVKDTLDAKKEIEEAIEARISGYRAPFFSLTDEKLFLLSKIGFSYDSSYIQSNANEYYNQMSLPSFKKVESLVYKNADFKEYEIPTLNNKPIAGGGFFRLYPFFVYKFFFEKFSKKNSNYIFFIHPFEIAGSIPFPGLRKMSFKDRIRFQLGRKKALKKIQQALLFFKAKGYVFAKFGED